MAMPPKVGEVLTFKMYPYFMPEYGSLILYHSELSDKDWILLADPVDVEVRVTNDPLVGIQEHFSRLRQEARAEFEAKMTELNRQLQRYLAIENGG